MTVRRLLTIAAPLVGALLLAATTQAETVKCQRSIAKAGSAFAQAKMKALKKCDEGVVKGSNPGPCPDQKATDAIAKATAKLSSSIGKSCGGVDKLCGGVLTEEDTPASLGWPAQCPNFERGACNGDLDDCGDIAACIACADGSAVDQAAALYYDALVPTNDKAITSCQVAIGKAGAAFLAAKSKALQKCWDARMNGKHSDPCVPPAIADGKYIAAIAKAETKKIATICKACGGSDKVCGGAGADIPIASIGFPATCPAVTVPGGAACAAPVTDVAGMVACVDCVTEFKVDCVDRLQVPQLTSYPPECNVCTAPPPSGPCPTTVEYTVHGPTSDIDVGFTGLAHDDQLPDPTRLTFTLSGCAGSNLPTCGQCTLSGPIANAGGAPFANRRCTGGSWVACTADIDCTNAGVGGPCSFFLGAPMPSVVGGVPACMVNRLAGPVSGTANPDDGSLEMTLALAREVYPTGTIQHPCPICVAGVCDDGPRDGQACTVGGSGDFGDVSLDCPPNPGTLAGTLGGSYLATTGTTTRTVTTANPPCRETGYTGKNCLCDTCNNIGATAPAQACGTNADCPPAGGHFGICGGRRCLGGSEDGKPCNVCFGGPNDTGSCTTASACPGGACQLGCAGGGSCSRPGEATRPNTCLDNTTTGADETICTDLGNGEGECPDGPSDSGCSIETERGCSDDTDCNPPPFPGSACPDCLPGQTCTGFPRPCFPGSGALGDSISVSGIADPPCDGASLAAVDGLFCVPPVAASAVNAAIGLPGLSRIRLPGTAVFQ